jgi:putative ABC transport system permease protein
MKRSLRSWLWQVPVHQEVDEELAFHIEMRTRDLIERGVDPTTARDMAVSRIGDVARLKRTCVDIGRKRDREMRLTQWIEELRDDVTFAVRQLKAAPAFTIVAVLTLALGIGANSAIFALADRVLLRPLPFPDADRLVGVFEQFGPFARAAVAPLNFRDWDERNRTFDDMAALSFGGNARSVVGPDGMAEQVIGNRVTVNFFDVLGVRPIAGRTFVSSDAGPSPDVVVLNEAFWQTRFGGDPTAVGRTMQIDSRPFIVIGVVPTESQVLGSSAFWTPYVSPPGVDERALHYMRAVGRLKPGVALEAARADMAAIAADLVREYPATNKARGVTVDPLRDVLISAEIGLTSWLLLGVVGFVLLMCCANVANLLLARTTARTRELAVRAAIGAGRRRIVAQIVTESLVLAAVGGLVGLAVGAAILNVAPALIPSGLLPLVVALSVDGRVVWFCVGITLVVGIAFGVLPALQATGISLVELLTSHGRSTGRGTRLRNLLAASEVAAAVLLLCGAGLLLRTLIAVERVDGGYGASNVLTMQVTLPGGIPGTRYADREETRRFYEAVEREISTLPGVRSVAWGRSLPLDHGFNGELTLDIVGDAPREPGDRPLTDYQTVSLGYFDTLEIPIIRGRGFAEGDTANAVPVCIVNEAFVRRYLQGREPIGTRISIRRMAAVPGPPVEREIVGVVRQVKGRPDEQEEPVHVYVPIEQDSWVLASLVVRPIEGHAEALTTAVRAAIARVDKDVPVAQIRTLADIAQQATSRQRFRAVLVVTFGTVALVLAMVGVFGVLAYSVEQRGREFGVRIALGAEVNDVLRLVLSGAVRVVGVGAGVGLALAAVLGRSLSGFLFGVQPIDLPTFGAVIAVVGTTAVVATAAPALRATRVDPAVTFRGE